MGAYFTVYSVIIGSDPERSRSSVIVDFGVRTVVLGVSGCGVVFAKSVLQAGPWFFMSGA